MVHAPSAMAAVMLTAVIALPFDSPDGSFGSVGLAPFDSPDGSFGSVELAQGGAAAAKPPAPPDIAVTEAAGVYRVTATFTVPASPHTVAEVLTDYERIPEFMPDVKTSQVLERTDSTIVVEQEAAAKFMMFKKRIHLILEVSEDGGTISFRDRCGKSFEHYEGAWRLHGSGDTTTVLYELTAKPSFEVPGFILKRLLKRDATALIDRLKTEITNRGDSPKPDRAK